MNREAYATGSRVRRREAKFMAPGSLSIQARRPRAGAVTLLLVGCALAACADVSDRPGNASRGGIPPSLVQLGDSLQRTGDAEGAETMYRAAVGQDGRNAAALERLGQALMASGDPGRAEQAFRAALVLNGDSAAAKHGLAVALLAQRRAGEALPLLAALAGKRPDARTLRTYGVALDMAGQQAEAQAAYRRGLELAPADPNLHGNLALSLAASGQMEAALAEMRAAQLAPLPDPRQGVNGILLLAVAGRGEEARRQGVALLGPARTEVVLRQAEQVRAAADAPSRATALGLLSVPQPPAPGRPEAARAGG